MDQDAQQLKTEIKHSIADAIMNLCKIYKEDDDMTSARFIMCLHSLMAVIACDAAGDLDTPETLIKTAKSIFAFGETIADYQS